MANQLAVTRTYADGAILGAAKLDSAFDSVEAFVNTTKLSGDNIQSNSISATQLQTSSVGTAQIADSAVSNIKIADSAVTLAKLSAALQAFLVPSSSIAPYSGDSAPSGWLLCDGSAVSRSTYATLFGIVGIRFGQGNGSTTFNLPDLRGRFLRGKDAAVGRDPDAAVRTAMATGGATGDNVGSIQGDDINMASIGVRYQVAGVGASVVAVGTTAAGSVIAATLVNSDATKTGLETRPKNANVNFIIKT